MTKTFYWLGKWRRANTKVFIVLVIVPFLIGLLIGLFI